MARPPSSSRSYLPHNSSTCLATGMSPLMAVQPSAPPFPYPGARHWCSFWRTDMAPQLPCSNLGRGFGSLPATYPSTSTQVSCLPVNIGPFEVVKIMNLSQAPSFVACVPYLPCLPAQASFPPVILSALGSCKNIPQVKLSPGSPPTRNPLG